jgi:hypothetical protein
MMRGMVERTEEKLHHYVAGGDCTLVRYLQDEVPPKKERGKSHICEGDSCQINGTNVP